MKKAVFIDRDGILNELDPERPRWIPKDVDQFKVTEGIRPLLKQLRDAGFVIIVTTHQPGLSEGLISRPMLERMHNVLWSLKIVDDIIICPHREDEKCPCCPPAPGLLLEAANKHSSITLNYSFSVSTRWQDMEAIKRVGGIPIQIQSTRNAKKNILPTVHSFDEAVVKILSMKKQHPS